MIGQSPARDCQRGRPATEGRGSGRPSAIGATSIIPVATVSTLEKISVKAAYCRSLGSRRFQDVFTAYSHSFGHSFSKYLLSIYPVPGTQAACGAKGCPCVHKSGMASALLELTF